jgi:hypothetical protein
MEWREEKRKLLIWEYKRKRKRERKRERRKEEEGEGDWGRGEEYETLLMDLLSLHNISFRSVWNLLTC